MKNSHACLATLIAIAAPGQVFALEHGSLEVVQLNTSNRNLSEPDPPVSVTVKPGSSPGFSLRNANRGDFDVAFSSTPELDTVNGVMITTACQNGRDNSSGGGPAGITYGVSHAEYSANGYFIPTDAMPGGAESGDNQQGGGEFNINTAAAWFNYDQGWLGGHGRNASNGAALTLFAGSPGISLGTEFLNLGGGQFSLDMTALESHGVPATSSNGVLLNVGGKNEDNFSMAQDNADGTFSLSVMDSGPGSATGYEQDGVAFAYVPVAAAGRGFVQSVARVQSDGSAEIGAGDYTITKQGTGEWLLTIPGHTDDTGTLIVSSEGGKPPVDADPVPNNTNNIICYEWNAGLGGWIIQSHSVVSATNVLEDGATPDEDMFSFVFLTQEPALALESPAHGDLLRVGEPVTVKASPTAATPAAIQQVEFFVNGVSMGTDTTAPYELSFTADTPDRYDFEAIATLTGGGIAGTVRNTTQAVAVVPKPQLPGYTMAIIDGGDLETELSPPSAAPAWAVTTGTPSPLGFTALGSTPGEPAIAVNGAAVPFDSGILLGTNYMGEDFADATTRGAIDNIIVPRATGGNYALAVNDSDQAGDPDPAITKESGRLALGFFPYANGWTGANIAADTTIEGGSANLPPDIIVTNASAGVYNIAGLPKSGNMLAIASGAGANEDNVASIGETETDWVVTVRDNIQDAENGDFAFLYIPENSTQVLSGKVADNGDLTSLNAGLDAMGATVTKVVDGYEILFGDGTIINPSTAALFLNGDFNNGNGGDNVYAYYGYGNKFVVFSHDLPGLGSFFQSGGFRFMAAPFAPVALPGNEVAVVPLDDLAQENSIDNGTLSFRLHRAGSVNGPLTVNYQMSGTATEGSDYTALPGSVTFAPGEATAIVTVDVLPDAELEGEETVTLTVQPGTGYTPGISSSRSGTIMNSGTLLTTHTVSFQQDIDGYTGTYSMVVSRATPRTVDPDTGVSTYGDPVDTFNLGRNVAADYLDGYPGHKGADPSGDSPDENGIVRFDDIFGAGAGKIPAGATIVSAQLVMTTNTGGNSQSGGIYTVDRLLEPVDEDTRYGDLDLGEGYEGVRGISGMSILQAPVAGFSYMDNGAPVSANVTSLVRFWAEDPSTNHGFSLFVSGSGTTDGWEYCTEGNADATKRPKLVVTYALPADTSTYTYQVDQSAQVVTSLPTTDGSTLGMVSVAQAADATENVLVRFPVSFAEIPEDEEILKAELLITTSGSQFVGGTTSAHSRGPVNVHRMLEDWTPTTAFGMRGPDFDQIAPARSAAYSMGQGSQVSVDVTNIVQAWRAGAPNYGLNLKPTSSDNWQFFGAGYELEDYRPQLRIITATTGPVTASPFELWAQAQGVGSVTVSSDADKDGILDIVEYALGMDLTAPDTLPGVTIADGMLHLEFAKGAEAAADGKMSYKIQTSTDLVTWTDASPVVNGAALISMDTPVVAGPVFYRLNITYAP